MSFAKQLNPANLSYAYLAGAYFRLAQCQGAHFLSAQCQGAHATDNNYSLANRIGKDTELHNLVFVGDISKEVIQNIESAKQYLGDPWYQNMQNIIEDNKGKESDNTLPGCVVTDEEMHTLVKDNKELPEDVSIITGVLKDSEEIQAIIVKDWDKLARIRKHNKK